MLVAMNRIVTGAALLAVFGSPLVIACVGDTPDVTPTTPGGLERGDFEQASCLGWETNEATAERDPTAREGTGSCRVCGKSGATSVWGIFQNIPTVAEGTYTARAFVRASGSAGPSVISLGTVALDDAGAPIGDATERDTSIAPGEDWKPVTHGLAVGPNQGATVSLMARNADGGCFLVDDVTFTRP